MRPTARGKSITVRVLAGSGWALLLGFSLSACAMPDWDSFRKFDLADKLKLPSMAAPVAVGALPAVTAEELVDSEGRCAGASPDPSAAGMAAAGGDPVTVPANAALAAGGIGLSMTECEVVKRAGPPEKVELGSNDRAERTATLSYIHGPRPGIYGFVAGRVVSIERAPEPPAPPKPAKPAKPAKSAKPKPKPTTT